MRPIWSGAISFGLVSVPCKVWPATQNLSVQFRQIHLRDNGLVKVKKVCEVDGVELSAADIGRGYETATGVIEVTDADLDSMPLTTAHSIDLVAFVPASTIDPLQVGSAYYLSPDGPTALKPYTLLRMALERAGKVAITKFAMRDRERLGALRVVGGVIALYQLRWPDEIRPTSAVPAPAEVDVSEDEIAAAVELANALAVGFDLSEQRDHYREAVEAVITAKAQGTRPESADEAAPAVQVVDLMAALQASVRDARSARGEVVDATVHDLPVKKATRKKAPPKAADTAKKTAGRRAPHRSA